MNANAGTFNNVTIAENCNVLGTIYANRIVGDVVSLKSLAEYGSSNNYTVSFQPSTKARFCIVSGIEMRAWSHYISNGSGSSPPVFGEGSVTVQVLVGGVVVKEQSIASGTSQNGKNEAMCNIGFNIPQNVGSINIRILVIWPPSGAYSNANGYLMISNASSGVFQ